MTTDIPNGVLQLELKIPAQWGRVTRVSKAVAGCVAAVFGDSDMRDALAMTTAELLENAIKYGKDGDGISVSLFDRPDEIVIQVINDIADEASYELLNERLVWLASFGNPAAAYAASLERAAENAVAGHDGSGLGLARIAYEGGCRLEHERAPGGRLIMRAHHLIERSAT